MQCPNCGSELEPNATECKQCGSSIILRRTTVGVFVGWLGMVAGIVWIMLFVPMTFLPFLGYNMGSFPWITLVIGAVVTVVLLRYSKKTRHPTWIRRGE